MTKKIGFQKITKISTEPISVERVYDCRTSLESVEDKFL